MAQLDVQPKKNNSWWLWVLLTIILLAGLFYYLRSRGRDTSNPNLTGGDKAIIQNAGASNASVSSVDYNASEISYEEVNDRDIKVRGNENFAIYSLDETVLFDKDKSAIKAEAAEKLNQISKSINQRFASGEVKILGFTDSTGSAGYNKELAAERAKAVREWVVKQGNIKEDRITIQAVGEANPAATNSTTQGRVQNRRVEILAQRKSQ